MIGPCLLSLIGEALLCALVLGKSAHLLIIRLLPATIGLLLTTRPPVKERPHLLFREHALFYRRYILAHGTELLFQFRNALVCVLHPSPSIASRGRLIHGLLP